jgi:hypothetical protein
VNNKLLLPGVNDISITNFITGNMGSLSLMVPNLRLSNLSQSKRANYRFSYDEILVPELIRVIMELIAIIYLEVVYLDFND